MRQPHIDLVPLRTAVRSDQATTLDVLVRITPPTLPATPSRRPTLNLGFVIDRSGSMADRKKIDYARQAVCYAIEQLNASDRLSVTIFDDQVETLIPNTPANNKASFTRLVQQVKPGGSTALHAGWVQGGIQVSQHLSADLNRVILLSDGLANVGETNLDVIASDVRGLAERGVSTSTMGVGDDYDEDLLEAIARSGDGNYYYISSAEQLPPIFERELQGLAATFGRSVALQIQPHGEAIVADVLNDLQVDGQGRLKLSNLLYDSPIGVLVRLKVPVTRGMDLCTFQLTWLDTENQPHQLTATLNLPGVSTGDWDALPLNADVQQQVALMMAARAKKEAVKLVDQGNLVDAVQRLKQTKEQILSFNLPMSAPEAAALEDLEDKLNRRETAVYRKQSLRQVMMRGHGRSTGHTQIAYALNQGPILGDITQQKVEAIVNSTDRLLSDQGALSSAIHRAAGPELLEACLALNGCAEGEAKMTRGFRLPAPWVIHTVCPSWHGGKQGEADLLAQCYRNCLNLAVAQGLYSIAFPALGIGGMGFPPERAARIAMEEVSKFLMTSTAIGTVLFVCFDPTTLKIYDAEFQRVSAW